MASAWALTACSSSGQNSGGGDPQGSPSYEDLDALQDPIRFYSARVMAEEGTTANLPRSGGATYAGVTNFALNDREMEVLAMTALEVDFGQGRVTGAMTDFADRSGTQFTGSVSIDGGRISGHEASANLHGTLRTDSAALGTIDISGSMNPDFIGDDADYLRGDVESVWVLNAGTPAASAQSVSGEVATAR